MRSLLDSVTLSKIVEIRDELIGRQNSGEKVYRLESGTPSYNLFPGVKEAMIRALHENKTFYTEGTGISPLKTAICRKLMRRNGIRRNISEENILVGQGGMGTLYCTVSAIAGRGDTVITPTPVWESIKNIPRLAGASVIDLDVKEELGFNWDMQEFEFLVETTAARAVIIVNPGNPTGSIFRKEDMHTFFDLVRRYKFYVVEDLAYEDIVYDDGYVMLTREAHLLDDEELMSRFIPVFSMSKSQNFSGLRIGYTYLRDRELVSRFRKILLYTTNGLNSIAQWGAVEALHERHDPEIKAMKEGYKERRDVLFDALAKLSLFEITEPPKGSFFLFPKAKREVVQELARSRKMDNPSVDDVSVGEYLSKYLLKHGVGSIAGQYFGESAKDYIRFSYTCSIEDIQELSAVFERIFSV
jgi:aspartate aminotransferase